MDRLTSDPVHTTEEIFPGTLNDSAGDGYWQPPAANENREASTTSLAFRNLVVQEESSPSTTTRDIVMDTRNDPTELADRQLAEKASNVGVQSGNVVVLGSEGPSSFGVAVNDRQLVYSHSVNGEQFELRILPDRSLRLVHPRWSLIGTGESLIDAEVDLAERARIVLPSLMKTPVSEMTASSIQKRDYLVSLV